MQHFRHLHNHSMCTVHVTPSSSPAASGPCRQSQTRRHARVHRKTTSRRRRSTHVQQPPSHSQLTSRCYGCGYRKHGLGPAAATGTKSGNTGTDLLRSERHPGFPDIRPPQTETLFHTYSQFSTVSDIPAKPTEEERTTEAKLQDLLEKVRSSPRPKDFGSHLFRCLERPY